MLLCKVLRTHEDSCTRTQTVVKHTPLKILIPLMSSYTRTETVKHTPLWSNETPRGAATREHKQLKHTLCQVLETPEEQLHETQTGGNASSVRLLVGVKINWYYAETAKIEIGKFMTYQNMKIASSVSSKEVHSDSSHVECSLRLLRLIQDNEDCSYYKNINKPSGVYSIQPEGVSTGMSVYCDMSTDGGGWIRCLYNTVRGVSTGMMVYCDMDTGSGGWIVSISLFTSDVYTIQPEGVSIDMMVYCLDTGSGGWIVSISLFTSDVYTIQPEGVSTDMIIYCDMDTGGSGWIVSSSLFTSDVYTLQPEGVSTDMMV
ncbi:unnamed protein product [Mytilus edulis]|uniref:Fibrinogen C-terminal domain-containing protein n=1 Tax=Mytilus edulis TaxID=6550 RepID=A0A8S3T1J6_MYTED|nr:unnamed protein product [Mytilus edulis]